jgi:16S rRNA (cytidine1402-2'-O)-methyltransferase
MIDKSKSSNSEVISKSTNSSNTKSGTLYVCATPIGNLGDVTFRLLETLKNADIILAEDTRKLRKILTRFEIKKNLKCILSYNDFSGSWKVDRIIEELCSGKNAALVSEAGMPAIQDPGYKIIRTCIDKNIDISVVPGPSAALSSLVLSGLPTDSFLFIGFLPKKNTKLKEKLQELKNLPYTMIFYESPLRIWKLLEILLSEMGDRNCAIAREMTKIHEEVLRGKISDIIRIMKERTKEKGEIAVVLEGLIKENDLPHLTGDPGTMEKNFDEKIIKKEYKKLILQKLSRKEALKILKDKFGLRKQTIYNITLKND